MNPMFTQDDLQWITKQWADHVVLTIHGASHLAPRVGPLGEVSLLGGGEGGGGGKGGRLRVGYLSSNLQGGAVWLMIQGKE